MKETNHISDITLEFYQMGLASAEEKQMIQEALKSDPEFIARYEAILQTDQKIREQYSWEKMPKLAALTKAATQVQGRSRIRVRDWIYNKRSRRVLIAVAAVLLCAIIPTLIYLKKHVSNKEMTVIVTSMPPPNLTEQQSDINIPAGITFIAEGMFVNKELSHVIIPAWINIIEKNAFAGNPLISVTIGANVEIDNEAFPGNFADAYTSYGKSAGTYSRSDVSSEIWKK
ncbi:leucine-rich repeat protein [Treponema sp. R80B11-R83G3]